MNNYSRNIFGNAFLSPDKSEVVAVYTNLSGSNYKVNFDLGNKEVESIKTYTTSKLYNLREAIITSPKAPIMIQPESVVTVVYKLK